ncbi:9566_t:CDS:2, partial [Ambispora gerdemannii]
GIRVSELVNIKHRDWQDNSLRIHGKGNKIRQALLPPFLVPYLKPGSRANDLGEITNIEIQFKSGKTLRTKPKDYVEPKDKKEIFLKPEEIILFFNNSTHTPNLLDAETIYLEDL